MLDISPQLKLFNQHIEIDFAKFIHTNAIIAKYENNITAGGILFHNKLRRMIAVKFCRSSFQTDHLLLKMPKIVFVQTMILISPTAYFMIPTNCC